MSLRAVHKRHPRSGGNCSVWTCCVQGGGSWTVLQMRTSALFGVKNLGFFGIYGVSARTRGGGVSQCGHFRTEKSIFRDFVLMSFMDGSLPCATINKKDCRAII